MLLAAALVPSTALAQKGGGAAGGGAAAGAAGGGAKGPVTGYSGGDNLIGSANPALWGGRRAYRVPKHRGRVPEYHTVRRGDTLWDLCDYYYGDPWAWPQLWAYNKGVSNPHWIYPGDKLRMLAGRRTRGGVALVRIGGRVRYRRGPIQLHQVGYIDPKTLEASGGVVGSRHEKLMMSPYDEVYVKGEDKFRPQVGQQVTFFKVRRKLKHKGTTLGHVIEILGSGRVRKVNKHKVATVQLYASRAPIERGARVGPLRRTYKRLPRRPADRDLKAHIVDLMRNEKTLIGTDELVFIDKGRKQGVELGNRFLVLRRGDGYRQILTEPEDDNPKFPYEVVAEIAVLDLRDDASVGYVTKAKKDLRVGDLLRLRRGY
ncbi:MAG: LysM peptidoglycan-binding domain-containing protein [Myxococcales bacterium]|nr:LysM peptidoglycan-binding domain-containing protein [Myxococcales bacterium]